MGVAKRDSVELKRSMAAWVASKKMSPFFAYDANYLIDNKLGIIVDAEEGSSGTTYKSSRTPQTSRF
jgi:hypothetical protein